jgi:DAACS family dicarboxylate/amino acid:cation (Na+ or H+) symporter
MSSNGKGMALHNKVLLGLGLGAVFGVIANLLVATYPKNKEFLGLLNEKVMSFVGDSFLAMIFMIVVPLLFSALVIGIGEIGDVAKVGRIGIRALLLTVLFSGLAVVLALVLVNVIQPGNAISEEKRAVLQREEVKKGLA